MSTSSESHESPILVTVRTFQPGDEESIWKLLNAAYPSKWGSLEWWRTKHSDRPGFDPLDIYVAEAEGRMLGCLHTAVIPVYVGPDLTVKLALDGDLAVHPDGRGRFIPERLYDFSRQQLYARGIPLRSGYTNIPLWEHIYKPRIGYISDFEPTRAFQKILDASLVRDRLLAMFHSPPDAPDPGRGPVLEVAITGIGKFQLRLARNVVATIPGAAARPTIRLEADQRIFGAFAPGGGGLRGLVPLWRQGDLRIRRIFLGAVPLGVWFLRSGRRLMRGSPTKV